MLVLGVSNVLILGVSNTSTQKKGNKVMYNPNYMTKVENAWWHFEASNQYQKLIKQCKQHKIDTDRIILEFLKTIPGDLGKDLISLYWNNSDCDMDNEMYYNAIECITEELIDKELL